MGRHADPTATSRRFDPRALLQPRLLIAAGVVLALVVGGIVWATASAGGCDTRRTVKVTVTPEVAGIARDLLAQPLPIDGGACAVATVRTQAPLETVANLRGLADSQHPDVWVPNSSLWRARTQDIQMDPAGSLAETPVVLATNQAAADNLGWVDNPPAWKDVLAAGRPLAVPDLNANVEALSAMAAVHASLGGGQAADNAVVQVALAAARGTVPAPAEAIARAAEGGSDAPLGALSEQQVLTTNRGAGNTKLVAIYPADGSPMLDFPVLRVGQETSDQRAAVDAVAKALTSPQAHDRVRKEGFRAPDGTPPTETLTGIHKQAPKTFALDATSVQKLLSRLASLTVPSSILAVIDVSLSMNEKVGDGTRATLARDAAKSAMALLPDSARIGLWVFAYKLGGGADYAELAPLRTLGAGAGGATQRQALSTALDTIPDRLAPGGTALYDTTLAAVRSAQQHYDADFVNSVVVITDGQNENNGGISLQQLLDTLKQEADPNKPVKVIAVGLGPDADMDVLNQIAGATGGAAYSAVDPRDLQSVLFQAIAARR